MGHKIYVKTLEGRVVAVLKKRMGVLLECYDIYVAEKKIAFVNQKILSFKPKITVSTQMGEYLIRGDVLGKNFVIAQNERTVAKVEKEFFALQDKYRIDIFEEENEELFVSIVIAIDNCIHS